MAKLVDMESLKVQMDGSTKAALRMTNLKATVSKLLFNNQIRLGFKTFYGVKQEGYFKQGCRL